MCSDQSGLCSEVELLSFVSFIFLALNEVDPDDLEDKNCESIRLHGKSNPTLTLNTGRFLLFPCHVPTDSQEAPSAS